MPDTTELVISGIDIAPYSARGLTQTLEPIRQSQQLRRTVNGVLIDIGVAHEGWQRDTDYPVAPCHPMWARQQSREGDFPNDCQKRLQDWSAT